MRFNINRPLNATWVDDVLVDNTNTSALPANVIRVQWRDQEGYIWYADKAINEKITDPSPYQSYINNWMAARTPFTLAEAKQIKIYFIETLFETKRQAPYAYTVATGAFTWEATDGTVANMSAMMVPVLYNLIGGLAEGGGANANSLINQINNRLSTLATNVNNNFSTFRTSIINGIVAIGNSLVSYINVEIVNKVNPALNNAAGPPPGFSANIPNTALAFVNPDTLGSVAVTPIDATGVTPTGATVQWTPIGQANPVNVTVTEMSGIMGGIAARRTALLTTKVNKTNAVNALTSITAVIAYDATAGW